MINYSDPEPSEYGPKSSDSRPILENKTGEQVLILWKNSEYSNPPHKYHATLATSKYILIEKSELYFDSREDLIKKDPFYKKHSPTSKVVDIKH